MPRIVIIGGGPAGALAGVVLARAGLDVTILESHAFPRDKVCGECLSATGVAVLRRHDLLQSLLDAGAIWTDRADLVTADGAHAAIALPSPMLGLSRYAMDVCLLSAARAAGATVLQPARATDITQSRVTFRDGPASDVRTLECDLILLADGKGAIPASPARPAPTGDLGVKAHFQGIRARRDTITLFGLDGHYGGVSAVEPRELRPGPRPPRIPTRPDRPPAPTHHTGRWNVALSVPADTVRRHAGDLQRVFDEALDRAGPGPQSLFAGAARVTPWLASPLPRFGVRPDWPPGIIPIGNAAAAIEPVGGEGMGLALASAERAATEILAATRTARPINTRRLRAHYRKLWSTRSLFCRAAAVALSRPAVATHAAALLDSAPALAPIALHLIGKSPSPHTQPQARGQTP